MVSHLQALPFAPRRLLPSRLRDGVLRSPANCQRIARRPRNHEIEKSFRASGSRRAGTRKGRDENLINGTGIVPCVRLIAKAFGRPAHCKEDGFPLDSQGDRARA